MKLCADPDSRSGSRYYDRERIKFGYHGTPMGVVPVHDWKTTLEDLVDAKGVISTLLLHVSGKKVV